MSFDAEQFLRDLEMGQTTLQKENLLRLSKKSSEVYRRFGFITSQDAIVLAAIEMFDTEDGEESND